MNSPSWKTRRCSGRCILPALALLVWISGFPVQAYAQSQQSQQDILDALLERRAFTPQELEALDVNQDGKVDVADLITSNPLPTASFALASSVAIERAATVNVPVDFGRTFTGTLNYSVAGTATTASDYAPLAGTLTVNGSTANIPVTLIKDLLFEGVETLIITIEPGTGYVLGAPLSHTLNIADIEVSFTEQRMVVDEGAGSLEVPVVFSQPYTGLLKYSLGGTATPTVDLLNSATGSISVNGSFATIPIDIVDDLLNENTEMVNIDLQFNFNVSDADLDYDLGALSRIIVLIQDNDTVWTGVMRTETSEEAFQMEVLTDGSQTQATIISSLDPNDAMGQASAGTIPPGEWAVTSSLGPDRFLGTVEPLPLGSASLFGNTEFTRLLTFDVDPSRQPYVARPGLLIGSFLSITEPTGGAPVHLRRETAGILILLKGTSSFPLPDREIVQHKPR